MNSWKEVPQYFVNGKFWVKNASFQNQKIIGFHKDGLEIFKVVDYGYQELLLREVARCTLVARPISDMTNDELKAVPSFKGHDDQFPFIKQLLTEYANSERMFGSDERYLSSLGVYFLPQQHFDSKGLVAFYENGGKQ